MRWPSTKTPTNMSPCTAMSSAAPITGSKKCSHDVWRRAGQPRATRQHLTDRLLRRRRTMRRSLFLTPFLILPLLAAGPAQAQKELDRTTLPIPEPRNTPITELDARRATPPPRFEVKAPQGAPNVVIVLVDDIGFGSSSAFGGPIQMPTLEKLAGGG